MSSKLVIRAGARAYDQIQKHGFEPSMIGTLAGASGGAKWLVLSQLDRVVMSEILPRLEGPVYTIGSSIGAWRFACYAQPDPLAAIERFENVYIDQTYSAKPDRREITEKSTEILDEVIPDAVVPYIVEHPTLRSNIMTVRARHALKSEATPVLIAGLVAAATLNAAYRRSLGLFFERALFYDKRDHPPFKGLEGFPLQEIPVSSANYKPAVLATGSIPLVLEGVADIPGARPGVYRDGGVIDYHLDLPHSHNGRLALYLHFYDYLKPGWFDKKLKHRRASAEHTADTVLVSPSPEFVERLPNRKIPDRHDFVNYPEGERIRAWRDVVAACRELADEFNDVLARGELASRLERLPG